MKRTERIKIDLKEKDFRELHLKQMDTTHLIFDILNNGKTVDVNDVSVNIIFTKPNGTVVIQNSNITINEDHIEVDLLPDCVRDYGKGLIEVELKENEENISTFQLICWIEKTGKVLTPSGNNDNYYEKAEKILDELQEKLKNGDFNGLSAYEEAVKNGFKGTESEWLESLKSDKPVKGVDYYTEEDKNEILENLQNSEEFKSKVDIAELEKYEKKHIHYKIIIKEEIPIETEYELPFEFTVGNDEFEIYYNNEYLIREKAEDDEANYKEVGENGTTSNKVKFGWDLRIGDVLDFIKKGVVENEENEN